MNAFRLKNLDIIYTLINQLTGNTQKFLKILKKSMKQQNPKIILNPGTNKQIEERFNITLPKSMKRKFRT